MVSFRYRYNCSSSSEQLGHWWIMQCVFPESYTRNFKSLYTQDLKDLISTSYFGDMCRHIHSGYQMLPVEHTTLVSIGRIWKTLWSLWLITMDFMFLSSFLHSFFGGADKIPFSLRRALVFHTGYSVILKMSCTALIDQ